MQSNCKARLGCDKLEPAMKDIHDYLLSPTGMARARHALSEGTKWFLHTSLSSNIGSIKSGGLRLAEPDCPLEPEVRRHLGKQGRMIVCFQPFPAPTLVLGAEGEKFTVAVHAASLPERIGLDWSYGGVWAYARSLVEPPAKMSSEDAFVKTVKVFGSVVSYDPVPASSLRVMTVEAVKAQCPSEWPALIFADGSKIALQR